MRGGRYLLETMSMNSLSTNPALPRYILFGVCSCFKRIGRSTSEPRRFRDRGLSLAQPTPAAYLCSLAGCVRDRGMSSIGQARIRRGRRTPKSVRAGRIRTDVDRLSVTPRPPPSPSWKVLPRLGREVGGWISQTQTKKHRGTVRSITAPSL